MTTLNKTFSTIHELSYYFPGGKGKKKVAKIVADMKDESRR